MLRIVLRFAGVAPLSLVLLSVVALAAENDSSHAFKFTIDSRLGMDTQGKKQQIGAHTVLDYTWKQRGPERTLIFDSAVVKADADGNAMMDVFMSRAKFANTQAGRTQEVLFENAPDPLKKMLQDSFGTPVCKLQVDENGKEVKREIVAGPGAKELIEQGIVANARLFHAPFMRTQNDWSAPAEVSMGNGGFAKGQLNYKKAAGGKKGQAVKVSGTLTNDGFNLPPLTIKNAKYIIHGDQTYDLAQGEWIAGKMDIDISFEMTASDKPVGSAKGSMVVTLEKPAGKK